MGSAATTTTQAQRPTTMRQFIRKIGIRCQPWRHFRQEIAAWPISAQTLVMNKGLPMDTLEQLLKEECYLFHDESLLEVLKVPGSLGRLPYIFDVEPVDAELDGDLPADFTEEDYDFYFNS